MRNPFRYGSIVSGDDYCRRPQLERRLRDLIRDGQNTLILGERRSGKTSLIHHVAAKLRGFRHCAIDLLGIKTDTDFLTRWLQGLQDVEASGTLVERALAFLRGVNLTITHDPVTGLPSISPSLPDRRLRSGTLRGLFSLVDDLDSRKRLVVSLDEFQDLRNLADSEQLLARLRGEIQRRGRIPFVFAGSVRHDMERIFVDQDSPFFKSAITLDVSPRSFTRLRGFLAAKFEATGKPVADGLMDSVFEICDHIPGDIQQLCRALWEVGPDEGRLSDDHLARALMLIFSHESRGYEAIVDSLTAQQLSVLSTLARLGGESVLGKEFLQATGVTHASSVKAVVTRLTSRRIIFKQATTYRFVNPFFRSWLIHRGY